MKLIRNQTADGSCKYALILLEKMDSSERQDVVECVPDDSVTIAGEHLLLGNESPADQFFVLKYRDKFAAAALIAYATAVIEYTQCLSNEKEAAELLEYANQIAEEARKSLALGDARHIPD